MVEIMDHLNYNKETGENTWPVIIETVQKSSKTLNKIPKPITHQYEQVI